MQNQEIKKILELKVQKNIFDEDCLKKINIQNAKEDEIFLLDEKKFSFIDIVFNCSYRKIALKDDSDNSEQQYNDYEIDYELIEEKMTDKFLRNKKLFNDKIMDFIYKFDFTIEDNDNIINKFNQLYMTKQICVNEKLYLDKFYKSNQENIILQKTLINDFKSLLNHLIAIKEKESNINEKKKDIEKTKIIEILKNSKNKEISDDFIKMFEKSEFTIDKIGNIFEYYLMLIFPSLIKEIKKYQIEIDDKKKKLIKLHNEQKDILIKKEIFALSTRLFISLVLFNEENKEKTIKENMNNIINYYSKSPDIWNSEFMGTREIFTFQNDKFKLELEEIKQLDIKINQIVNMQELIGNSFDEKYFKDLREEIEKNKRKEEEQKIGAMEETRNENEKNEGKENKKEDDEEEEEEEEEEKFKRKRKSSFDDDDSDRD